MAITAPGYVNRAAVEEAVRAVESRFAPEVAGIRYSFEEDPTDTPAIFFRILVEDGAAEIGRLRELVRTVPVALMNEVRTGENGLHSYYEFRSVSERLKLKDPYWD